MVGEDKSDTLSTLSEVVGYIYTVAWGVSFLGQIGLNFKLKNVKGCNLDFVIYNVVGFIFYSLYNSAGYFKIKNSEVTGIDTNDLVFSYWSLTMTIITLAQCIYYPKMDNKVSLTCKIASPLYLFIVGFYMTLEYGFDVFTPTNKYYNGWYIMSYVKLWISLTKYMPQAYWNYKRKSTQGWSIFNIILDFTGGTFSMAQIAIDSANGSDSSFSNGLNVTKFGLSIISICFDILFMTQHYCLYNPKNQKLQPNKELIDEAAMDEPFVNKVIVNQNDTEIQNN